MNKNITVKLIMFEQQTKTKSKNTLVSRLKIKLLVFTTEKSRKVTITAPYLM